MESADEITRKQRTTALKRERAARTITRAFMSRFLPDVATTVLFAAGSLKALAHRSKKSTRVSREKDKEHKGSKLLQHVDLDESEGAKPVEIQLKEALSTFGVRIISLFRLWDTDEDGVISAREFEDGLRTLGLEVPSTCIQKLFSSWDDDGSGHLTLKELAFVLNESTVENPLSNVDLDESPGAEPISEQLKAALSKNSVRIISLFKSWDNDGDGTISLEELETGLRTLGLDVPAAYIDEIYTSWDIDGNGTLTLKELATVLNSASIIKPLSEVDLDESPGAPPINEQLQVALQKNAVHILTLFRSWDEVMLRALPQLNACASCHM